MTYGCSICECVFISVYPTTQYGCDKDLSWLLCSFWNCVPSKWIFKNLLNPDIVSLMSGVFILNEETDGSLNYA